MKVLLVPSGNPQTVQSAKLLAARLVIAGIDSEVQPRAAACLHGLLAR